MLAWVMNLGFAAGSSEVVQTSRKEGGCIQVWILDVIHRVE